LKGGEETLNPKKETQKGEGIIDFQQEHGTAGCERNKDRQ
jgi:hypothetical protein